MTRNFGTLTIRHAQKTQPWSVPYSAAFGAATGEFGGLPHLYGSHAVLHAQKTLGQIAAIFESLDHTGAEELNSAQQDTLEGRTADLLTAALRLANLYGFDLAQKLVERSEDKNAVILRWPLDN